MYHLKIIRLAIEMISIGFSFQWVIEKPQRLLDDEIFPFEVFEMLNVFLFGHLI
jgi:hypothetical protein